MNNKTYYEDYFVYKDVAYAIGTKVIFNDATYQYIYNAKAKNQPHTFITGSSDGWKGFYWEDNKIPRPKQYCNHISVYNPDEEIKEIIEPVYYQSIPWQKKAVENMTKGTIHPDIFGGVIIYIVTMLVGALFFARLTIWIFATIVFVSWLLNQYRN